MEFHSRQRSQLQLTRSRANNTPRLLAKRGTSRSPKKQAAPIVTRGGYSRVALQDSAGSDGGPVSQSPPSLPRPTGSLSLRLRVVNRCLRARVRVRVRAFTLRTPALRSRV